MFDNRVIWYDTESPVGRTPSGVLGFVCLTYIEDSDPETSNITTGQDALDLWLSWIRDPAVTLWAHSHAHDATVLAHACDPTQDPGAGPYFELVWQAYEAGRLRCTYIRQRLADIRAGVGYLKAGLGPLVKRYELGQTHAKEASPKIRDLLRSGAPVQEWPAELREASPVRFRYGEWAHLPPDQWPPVALEYALDDPRFGRAVQLRQDDDLGDSPLPNELDQTLAAFDFEILEKHGWLTDRPRVQRLLRIYRAVMVQTYQVMRDHGLVNQKIAHRGKTNERCDESLSTSAIRALVWDALGAKAPLPKESRKQWPEIQESSTSEDATLWYSKHISTDADVCTQAVALLGGQPLTIVDAVEHVEAGDLPGWINASGPSGAAAINARRLYMKARHAVTHWLESLDTDERVRTSYNPLMNTGRVSSRQPNIQNFPRDADKPSDLAVRGCIVPDHGRPFIVADYSQLELCTLAQTLTDLMRWKLGDSTYLSSLAKAINEGMDCHLLVAATALRTTYAEVKAAHVRAKGKPRADWSPLEALVAPTRQIMKIGNYGYGGGMGTRTFVTHAAKQGQLLTLNQAEDVKHAFVSTWHEMPDYFKFVSDEIKYRGDGNRGSFQLPRSKRVRGGCFYTEMCNYGFQGPASDGCKVAARMINDACFRKPESALYRANARPVAFIHDEFIAAIDEAHAPAGLKELERLMVAGMRVHTPDVQIEAEGRILTERWSK